MQRSWSMVCTFFADPEMHETGQALAQAMHPTHFSALIS
jgi:hypothetical protein